jgi:hypothetical protein
MGDGLDHLRHVSNMLREPRFPYLSAGICKGFLPYGAFSRTFSNVRCLEHVKGMRFPLTCRGDRLKLHCT